MTKKYKKWAKMKSIIEKFHSWLHGSPWDIFWAYIGSNIGNEICWHGNGWIRPVLVLRRYGNLHLIAPMTSHGLYEDKENGLWLVKKYHHKISSVNFGRRSYLILNQIQTIDGKRFISHYTDKLGNKIRLWDSEFLFLKNEVRRMLK